MYDGCGFECPGDMGDSTCNRAKRDYCKTAIREASCSAEPITSVELPPNERWDAVYAGEAWENLTIWYQNDIYHESTTLPFTRWMVSLWRRVSSGQWRRVEAYQWM